jgi:hypothetical protein
MYAQEATEEFDERLLVLRRCLDEPQGTLRSVHRHPERHPKSSRTVPDSPVTLDRGESSPQGVVSGQIDPDRIVRGGFATQIVDARRAGIGRRVVALADAAHDHVIHDLDACRPCVNAVPQ